jgi:hypothetical protein
MMNIKNSYFEQIVRKPVRNNTNVKKNKNVNNNNVHIFKNHFRTSSYKIINNNKINLLK